MPDHRFVKPVTCYYDGLLVYALTQQTRSNIDWYDYTRAQNVDFNEPLPEITPLTGLIAVKYEREQFWGEFKGRLVAEQDRVSTSFDESTTPGFNVFDLMAGYSPIKSIDLSFALKNIFDVNYFEHLSRPYKNLGEQGMFYEPGRSFRVGLKLRF